MLRIRRLTAVPNARRKAERLSVTGRGPLGTRLNDLYSCHRIPIPCLTQLVEGASHAAMHPPKFLRAEPRCCRRHADAHRRSGDPGPRCERTFHGRFDRLFRQGTRHRRRAASWACESPTLAIPTGAGRNMRRAPGGGPGGGRSWENPRRPQRRCRGHFKRRTTGTHRRRSLSPVPANTCTSRNPACTTSPKAGRMIEAPAHGHGDAGAQIRGTKAFQEGIAMVHEGAIGKVLVAKTWVSRKRPNIGHCQPSCSAARLGLRPMGRPGRR